MNYNTEELTAIEKNALRYLAVRNFKDARDPSFYEELDLSVDSFLCHLQNVEPETYELLKLRSKF